MTKILQALNFNSQRKVILIGYDLGGAISLSCCLNTKFAKIIELIAVFHPTWTDAIEKLSAVTLPTLLLWFSA